MASALRNRHRNNITHTSKITNQFDYTPFFCLQNDDRIRKSEKIPAISPIAYPNKKRPHAIIAWGLVYQ